jgi:hypothetical protein
LEPDLSERYNEGIVPEQFGPSGRSSLRADALSAGQPARLQRPAWQPGPAQVEAARKPGRKVKIAMLALLACACLFVFALTAGWRP